MTGDPIRTLKLSERDLDEALENLRELNRQVKESVGFLEQLRDLGEAILLATVEQEEAADGVWKKNSTGR